MIGIRRAHVLLFLLCICSCGVFHPSEVVLPPVPATATSPGPSTAVEIKRAPEHFMLSDSMPVFQHPDQESAVITYVPRRAYENTSGSVVGNWLLVACNSGIGIALMYHEACMKESFA
jgi:hypothetical protein